jgi:hypothetical protein
MTGLGRKCREKESFWKQFPEKEKGFCILVRSEAEMLFAMW